MSNSAGINSCPKVCVQHQKKIMSGNTTRRKHQILFMLPSYIVSRSYVATWKATQFLLVDITENQNSFVLW
jgi:hypothetical protein